MLDHRQVFRELDPIPPIPKQVLSVTGNGNPTTGFGVAIEPLANPAPYHYGNWDVGDFIHKRGMDFFQGNVVKYVDRFRRKDGKKDLLKARDYIDKLIALNYP